MYELKFSQEAVNQLSKLEHQMAKRIMRKLEESKTNPHRYFKQLSNSRKSKLRVGDYRVVALILEKESTILVSLIGHRKNIYKR